MKLAYLILAHSNPQYLRRLINALNEDWTWFFIHIDRKVDIRRFRSLLDIPRVTLIDKRVRIFLGTFSLVQAELNLLEAARQASPDFSWFALLSGADYPVRPNIELLRYLQESRSEHINIAPMPCPEIGKPISRLSAYHIEGDSGDGRLKSRIIHSINRFIERRCRRDYKRILGAMKPYAGCQWWVLSGGAADYVSDFIADNRDIVGFFRHTVCPDEMFFQTILGNSPYKDRIERNLTYSDWSAGGMHPAYLTNRHLSLLESRDFELSGCYGEGKCFFARKFGPSTSTLIDRLDAMRNSRRGENGSATLNNVTMEPGL
jgi:hypothetical protein